MRRIFLTAVKLSVSAALLYFALRNTDFAALVARLTFDSIGWIALAMAIAVGQIAFGALRWRLLSDLCDAPLDVATALRFNVIGTFFNQTLPSSIGGDAVRLWLVGRRAGWKAATYSVFIDRAIGLIALAMLILVCLPWSYGLIGNESGRVALLMIEAAALGAGAGFVLLGVLPWRWLDTWRPTHHVRRCAIITDRALFGSRRGPVVMTLSVSVHVLTVLIAWCCARAIAAPVALLQLLLLLPPVALITLLPVSIAGWGLRETALGAAFASAGLAAAEGVNVSLVYGALLFLVGSLGGLVWIASAEKAEKGAAAITMPAPVA